MKNQYTNETDNVQSKVLLIRILEILRKTRSDCPLSLEDIRQILIEDDRARGINEDPQKDKYNLRLLRANVKAINAALERLPSEINISANPEREELLERKLKKEARKEKKSGRNTKEKLSDTIEKIIIGKGESKECLYYNRNALSLDEIKFLYDAVRAQDCLPQESADKLRNKLIKLMGRNFEPWEIRMAKLPAIRYEISNVFDTIHKIEQAIKDKKRLSFKYLIGQNVDRECKWEPGLWWRFQEIDPIAVYYKDGHYYLYGFNYPNVDNPPKFTPDRYRTLQLDRMVKVQVLDMPSEHAENRSQVFKTWENYRGRKPDFVSWTGEVPTEVLLRTTHKLVPELFEKFGPSLKIRRIREKSGQVKFKISVNYMEELFGWLASCPEKVEIIKPISVRDAFKAFLGKS